MAGVKGKVGELIKQKKIQLALGKKKSTGQRIWPSGTYCLCREQLFNKKNQNKVHLHSNVLRDH